MQIAWLFWVVGFEPMILLANNVEWAFRRADKLEITNGKVLKHQFYDRKMTGDTTVYAIHFSFELEGEVRNGKSFVANEYPEEGAEVTIEYVSDNPDYARIQNMHHQMFEPIYLTALMLPIIFLGMIAAGLWINIKIIKTVRNGRLGTAILTSRHGSQTAKGRIIWNFEYHIGEKRYSGRSNEALSKEFEAGQDETMIYYAEKPSQAYLLADLPGKPEISPDGQLEPRKRYELFIPLLMPLSVLLIVILRFSLF